MGKWVHKVGGPSPVCKAEATVNQTRERARVNCKRCLRIIAAIDSGAEGEASK